jgi:hypothetical protein
MRWESKRRLVLMATAVGVLAFFIVWAVVMHYPRVQYTPAAVFCRPLYAAARTPVDTSRVDATTTPTQRTEGDMNPLRCGDLRRAGLLADTAAM